jgi:hypothetical protein
LRTALKKIFWQTVRDEVARQMPDLSELKGEVLPSVCRVYRWGRDGRDGDTMAFFVMFQADRHDDAFTVEIGWSNDGHWPQTLKVRPPEPSDAKQGEGVRIRLGRLWMDKDVWWRIDENRNGLDVKTQVKEAVRCVATQGTSYLDRIGQQLRRNARQGDA